MMHIVMFSPRPERQEMVQGPRKLIAAVRINSLGQPAHNPEIHGQDVKVLREAGPENRNHDCTGTENHRFDRRRVFSGETKGCGVLVVDLVDILVERTPVHRAVHPIMPSILQHKKDSNLNRHRRPGRERHAGVHAAGLGHWVEEPDLGEFDGEVGEEDEFCAGPLLGDGGDLLPLDLVFVEIGDAVDYDPGETAAEVDGFVHDEAEDSGGEDIVLHVGIPALRGVDC